MPLQLWFIILLLGYSRKNPHTPDRWARFSTPLPSPARISKAKDLPPARISQKKIES